MQLLSKEYAASVIHHRPTYSRGIEGDTAKIILKTRHAKQSLNLRVKTALPKKQKHSLAQAKEVKFGPRLTLQLTRMLNGSPIIEGQSSKKKILKKRSSPPQRTQQMCFTHSPQRQQTVIDCDETLLKNSSKLKLLHSNRRQNVKTILVLPAEFLLNEFSFWKDDQIDNGISKIYRSMTQNMGIVWLVKKEKTVSKIIEFCNKGSLPLDSIYFIQKSKKVNISVNYEPIVRDFANIKTFLAFEVVRIHSTTQIQDYSNLENKLPLTSSSQVKLNLIKTDKDLLPIQLLQSVAQIILGELQVKRSNLNKVFNGYIEYLKNYQDTQKIQKKKRKASVKVVDSENEQEPQEEVLTRIQQLKRKWIPEINKSKQSSQGQSVHFIVGDLLKRNFQLMIDMQKQCNKGKDIAECTTAATSLSRRCTISRAEDTQVEMVSYNTPVYICCF